MWQTVFHYISLAPTHQTFENQMPSGSGSMCKYRGGTRNQSKKGKAGENVTKKKYLWVTVQFCDILDFSKRFQKHLKKIKTPIFKIIARVTTKMQKDSHFTWCAGRSSRYESCKCEKCIQMYTNVYKCIQMYTNVYKCIQMYTNVYKCIQMYTNVYKCIQMWQHTHTH